MRIARRLVIRGRVQGVWYRGWMVDRAMERDLDGWVRNRADGTVEAIVAGEADDVDELICLCQRGPRAARVDAVDVAESEDPGSTGFDQRPTV